jgi:hypothetical protein
MTALTVLHGCATIQVSRGRNALVDVADFPSLAAFAWTLARGQSGVCYAGRNVWLDESSKYRRVGMHRILAGDPAGMVVDHRNGDGLDNRRANLRVATNTQNVRNMRKSRGSSKFKGVTWHGDTRKWVARIMVDRKGIYLGLFPTEELAAAAYDEAAIRYFGEFACTNAELFGKSEIHTPKRGH